MVFMISDEVATIYKKSLYPNIPASLGLTDCSSRSISVTSANMLINSIFRLVLNPKQSLCREIKDYTRTLKQRPLVCLQFRMGGKIADTNEFTSFLNGNNTSRYVSQVIQELKKAEWDPSSTNFYISSDSSDTVSSVSKLLAQNYNVTSVFVPKFAQRGHSALRYNQDSTSKVRFSIFELFVLKECDWLFYTFKSTYGHMAQVLGVNNRFVIPSFHLNASVCSVYSDQIRQPMKVSYFM